MDSMPPTAWTCFELEAWPLGNQRSKDLVEAGEWQKEASMEWGRLGWLLQLRKTAIPPHQGDKESVTCEAVMCVPCGFSANQLVV